MLIVFHFAKVSTELFSESLTNNMPFFKLLRIFL